MSECIHKRGDWITEKGFWLCADCFAKMDSRPIRYTMVMPLRGSEPWTGPRQEILWQAATASADGVTLNDFLRTMARRFMTKTRPRMDRDDAYDMAISVLQTMTSDGDAYGDPAYDWSHDGAREIADDEMQFWDHEGAGENA